MEKTVKVSITSDVVCPWCFVGKKNLEKAIEQFKDKFNFVIEWKPYFLHGNSMPEEGMKLEDYLFKVYRIRMDLGDVNSPLNKAGEKVNIKFNNTRRMINTQLPHRLVEYSKQSNLSNQLMEVIFHQYFENAVDISKIDNLVEISSELFASVGISSDQIKSFLEGNQFTDHISAQISQANSVRGVPHFVITHASKSARISGAQSTESFVDLFESFESS